MSTSNDTGTFSKEFYLGKGDIESAGSPIVGVRSNPLGKVEVQDSGRPWRRIDIADESYTTYTYNGSTTIASMIIWTSVAMTTRIKDFTYTYDGILIDTEVVREYDSNGDVALTLTYTYNYTDGKVTSVTCVES